MNPNAKIRHHWTPDNTCMHCGLQRKDIRWKTLLLSTSGNTLRYHHKTVYSFDGFVNLVDPRPKCTGKNNRYADVVDKGTIYEDKGTLTENDYL